MKATKFESRIIKAARYLDDEPYKDFLDRSDIEEAILRLADVYTALGITIESEVKDEN